MARKRGFGELERRRSASGAVTYRARYAMSDGTRYSRIFGTSSTPRPGSLWNGR